MDRHPQRVVAALPCPVCQRGCLLGESRPGACGLYELKDGLPSERFPDRYLVACPISVETVPLVHYHPGAKFFQISTTGCNFDCPGCISTVLVREMPPDSKALKQLTPDGVVHQALDQGCLGIAFLMNDPLASLPTFLRVADLARAQGLKVGCASNAYFSESSLGEMIARLDFINLGMKGFSDASYRACGAPGLEPVLRNLHALFSAGVHVEVSCMYRRDKRAELRDLARHLARFSCDFPLQLMRFLPFETVDMAQEPPVAEAEEFCAELRGILNHVYLFNTPGSNYLHTFCPSCGHQALRRDFYGPMGSKLLTKPQDIRPDGRCQACGHTLGIQGTPAAERYLEKDFEGGYPLTRALEMVEAMLLPLGIDRQEDVVAAWEDLLGDFSLQRLHQGIQQPPAYVQTLRHFGRLVGAGDRTEELAGYLEQKLTEISTALAGAAHMPRVYYAMAKPLFYINGGRLENQLANWAGGRSVNQELEPGGRPGRSLSVERLNALDPEVIMISAFISSPVEDFTAECRRLGIRVAALDSGRVHNHPAPGWDFGSPRWVLGLMHLANLLHPEIFSYDVRAEADAFHRRFYGVRFRPQDVNRSFAKPSRNWRWAEPGS